MSHLDEGVLHGMLDGEVSSGEIRIIEAHLKSCSTCTNRFEEARRLRDEAFAMIGALDEVPVGLAVGAPPRAAPAISPRARDLGRWRRVRAWAPAAAWAATIVAAVGLGLSLGDQPQTVAVPEASMDVGTATPPTESPKASPPAVLSEPAPVPGPARTAKQRERQRKEAPAASRPAPTASAATGAVAVAEPERLGRRDSALGGRAVVGEERSSAADAVTKAPAPRTQLEEADLKKSALKARPKSLADNQIKLDEVVVTGTSAASPVISADQAIEALGGSIRLIDGLTPARYERVGELIRVVYETGFGPLILEQWRAANVVRHRLITPKGVPSDTVSAWTERIR